MADIGYFENGIYSIIRDSKKGVMPLTIARDLKADLMDVRRALTSSRIFRELCYEDSNGRFRTIISGHFPYSGFEHFSAYYDIISNFVEIGEDEFYEKLKANFFNKKEINVMRCTMLGLITDIDSMINNKSYNLWSIAFNVSISLKGAFSIKSDALLMTPDAVFPIMFFNSDKLSEREINLTYEQLYGYSFILGEKCRIIPIDVLMKASNYYSKVSVKDSNQKKNIPISVCSRDILYNALDEIYGFLKK